VPGNGSTHYNIATLIAGRRQMTELLTYDQAVAERNNPRLQYRDIDDVALEWRDAPNSYFPFYTDERGDIRGACQQRKNDAPDMLVQFRLKPEPREWWDVRNNFTNDIVDSFDTKADARIRVSNSANSDRFRIFHVREVLDDE
jgi:hypothetical protein